MEAGLPESCLDSSARPPILAPGEGGEVTGRDAVCGLGAVQMFLALACATRPAGTEDSSDRADAAAPTGAQVFRPERAVAGFPFPIRLVFRGEASVPVSTGLFEADNPFAIALRPVAGRVVRTTRGPDRPGRVVRTSGGPDRPGRDGATYVFPVRASRRALLGPLRGRRSGRGGRRETGRPTFTLPEGRTCEIVLDLSGLVCLREKDGDTELCRFRRLAPGAYELEIGHPSPAFKTPARPVEFLAPTPPEHRLLARLNNFGPAESIWRTFVLRHPEATEGMDLADFRPEARAQMGYHLMLARLVHSESPVAEFEITDDEIAQLLPAYRTEALLLRFEVELARGDDEAVGKTRSGVLAARPYAAKALEGIAERGGLITDLRGRIATSTDSE